MNNMTDLKLPKPFEMNGKIYYAHLVRPSYGKTNVVLYHEKEDLSYINNDPWIQQSVCGMTYLHLINWLE